MIDLSGIVESAARAMVHAVIVAFVLGCLLTGLLVWAWPHLPSVQVIWR